MDPDIRCVCPNCQQHIEAPADMAGTPAECPTCRSNFIVPCLPPQAIRNSQKKTTSNIWVFLGWSVIGVIFFAPFFFLSNDSPNEKNKVDTTEQPSSSPSIEQVNTFPENYIGQSIVFTECKIVQELTRLNNSTYFALEVTSKGGQLIMSSIGQDRITFVVSKSMAEKLAAKFEGGFVWANCTISCKVTNMKGLDYLRDEVIVALVSNIVVHRVSGKVGLKFSD